MPSKNFEVNKRARDKWYYINKEKQVARQIERRKELTQWFWEYKASLSCADCGLSFSDKPECCDFHHLDPTTKKDGVIKMVYHSRNALLKEVSKCVPLCANCHRVRHKDVYRYYKTTYVRKVDEANSVEALD
jgi:hypothetical protein